MEGTMTSKTARCACGALRVEAEGDPAAVIACHCMECQRRTGSVVGVGAYYPAGQLKISGASKLFVRDAPDGRKMRNHFCPNCGTCVYWEADLRRGLIGVAVGAFGDPDYPSPMRSVWEQSRHGWVGLSAELPNHIRGTDSPAAR